MKAFFTPPSSMKGRHDGGRRLFRGGYVGRTGSG
nr:MAG TPA: hypothetical protein [Caudoviricetes sp.]